MYAHTQRVRRMNDVGERVTFNPRQTKCNAKAIIRWRQCFGCERRFPFYQRLGTDGTPKGRALIIGAHCHTCHSDEHNCCEVCGKCLPPIHFYSANPVRVDRRHCSNACRQKAYRQRAGGK